MSLPKRLTIEYEDGSKKMIDFNQLKREVWLELSRIGLCQPPPALLELLDNYILLRWKDGWQEVRGIPKACIELLRYYTIERTEEVGRMAFEVGEEYPILFIIKRLPRQVEGLWVIGGKETKFYSIIEKRAVKEGGKIEHILYDKNDPSQCKEDSQKAETLFREIIDGLKVELKKYGLTANQVLAMEASQRVEKYKALSKDLGIRPMERQEDVYRFMELFLGKIDAVQK